MGKIAVPPYVHLQPAPAVLIGCGTVEQPNLITCAWFGTVASEPPMVSVSIRPSRFSHPFIEESGEFTVNLPTSEQLHWVEYCGSRSGREGNKFEKLGITAVPCPPLEKAPMVEECFLTMACKVRQKAELGTHTIFIAEVVNIWGDEEYKRRGDQFAPRSEEQLVYLDGRYWTLQKK